MPLLNTRLTARWRYVVGIGLGVCLGASTMASVPASAPTSAGDPAAVQAQDEDPLKFTRSGKMLLVYQVSAGKAEDFSLTWRTIKDRLGQANDPALAAFSRSLHINRVETATGADAIFVFDLDPVSTTYSYHPVTLLFETLAEDPEQPGVGLSWDEATALYDKIKDATAATWWLSSIDGR